MIEIKISQISLESMRKYTGFFCIMLLAMFPGTSLAESTNLVINPGFDSGTTPWLFYTNGGGTFGITSSDLEGNNFAKLAFGGGGTNIQLYQDGMTLEPYTRYRLNFSAYSDTGHDMLVNLMGIPYIPYGLVYKADLGTNWQTFTTEFTTKRFSNRVNNGRLQFWFADFASKGDTYYIDDIQLEQVNTQELPIIITQPSDQTVTIDQNTTFSVEVTGTEPLSYQWQKDGVNITTATGPSYTTPVINLLDNGTKYNVIVSNIYGSVTSNEATILVIEALPIVQLPGIVTQPSDQKITEGQTATFSLVATGTAPLTYQWQYLWNNNYVDLPGATNPSFTTPAATLSNTGAVVRVIVSNSKGSVMSNTATLTVTPSATPPGITTQPSSQTVNEGQPSTFRVEVTGTAPLTYQWQYLWNNNYVDLPGATNPSFTTPAATLSNTGAVVRVIVSNSQGSVTSNLATLTVIPSATLPGITTHLSLHPDNNHYFIYKGKPAILIGSNEHYGAVLNLDFDYDLYLNELQSKGLNYVRIFSGTYIEPDPNMGSWWDIDDNTLAPTNNGFISPWARSTTIGFAGDPNSYKFDLSQWDIEYFNRLRDFVGKADRKGIVVEYVFFTPFWSKDDQKTPLPNMWARSPMNINNNINNAGATASWDNDGYEMVWDVRAGDHNGGLTPYMGNMVTKVVKELNEFDNVIFQPGIETYKGDGNGGYYDPAVTMETIFEDYINSKIIAADTPKKHLISQNRDTSWDITKNIRTEVDVVSWDSNGNSDIVTAFYKLNKPLSNDEITYLGRGDAQYRRAGWNWIIAGGAIFNMLDLSFTPYRGEEAGTKVMPYSTSNGGTLLLGGSASLRTQLGILNTFIQSFNFVKMSPDNSVIISGAPYGTKALVENGKQYAIYLPGGTSANLIINLPAGSYKADWINTKTGGIDKTENIVGHTGGNKVLISPEYSEDIALSILNTS